MWPVFAMLWTITFVLPCYSATSDGHFLYVVEPGIRNQLEYGGAGILVIDVEHGHRFVRRIETPASKLEKPENIKGVCASLVTRSLYFTTLTKLYRVDLTTDATLWERKMPGGADRLAMTPDGRWLYVPSLEGPHWSVVDADSSDIVATITPNSGAHNTVTSLDGAEVYLAGLKSPLLTVADPSKHKAVRTVGPFSASIRPFTVNASRTLCFCCVNDLLGFEIGDLKTGNKIHRVEVAGFQKGTPKRHGCPSHGVGLTPDEQEVWVCDAANRRLHVFDVTKLPPKQGSSIKLREEPGWVTFSIDGSYGYPSTGEVIDTKTKKVLTALSDEKGREVHSEKMIEVFIEGGKPVRVGDQFGVGRADAKE